MKLQNSEVKKDGKFDVNMRWKILDVTGDDTRHQQMKKMSGS